MQHPFATKFEKDTGCHCLSQFGNPPAEVASIVKPGPLLFCAEDMARCSGEKFRPTMGPVIVSVAEVAEAVSDYKSQKAAKLAALEPTPEPAPE